MHFSSYPLHLAKVSLLLSLCSFFLTSDSCVLRAPAPQVLIHTYDSHLSSTMLGVTMLRDVPRQTICAASSKVFWKSYSQLCIKTGQASTVTYGILSPLHHDQFSCRFIHIGVQHPSTTSIQLALGCHAPPVPHLQKDCV